MLVCKRVYIYICIYWCKAKFCYKSVLSSFEFLNQRQNFDHDPSIRSCDQRWRWMHQGPWVEVPVWRAPRLVFGKAAQLTTLNRFPKMVRFHFSQHITCHILLLNPKNYAKIEKRAVEILAPNQDLGMKTCQDFQPNCWSALAFSVSKNLNWGPSISPSELQCEAPKIAKLVYNSSNYGLWYL